ncbi:protoporphyrinogen/coproporphyrinogen oxidase [Hymenobacter profundi]|uniref:FAD-dependent oxidoreductase n=1 Tax=Hymenobacter profundi TaxID=1982110 RepID=A0ABS6WVE5_9BACT|nr:FAD-dependent oxidoreductase [Hymenobacter profundi]MBW3127593.1 FAD-dependent oxidoreductase [Hymenobacter profundi]
MIVILGAGLAGISASYHIGHSKCQIFEQHAYAGGHIHSETRDGFIWDEGPHVSFTKSEYVRDLFASSTEFVEYPVFPANYYKGSWIPHPAQTNLYAAPQEIREECVKDFLSIRESPDKADFTPANYQEWLEFAYGNTFADNFPGAYTRKYWTTEPQNLTTDWVGGRMYFPAVNDVLEGAQHPLEKSTHYITSVRYPKTGGYLSFAQKMLAEANIEYGKKVSFTSFKDRTVCFSDGTKVKFEKLISTIPLPVLIQQSDAPDVIKEAASQLSCSSVLLVNIIANHPTQRENNWIYVYDEDKYSSRINFTELLSPANGIVGKTGIQVEVYFSKYKPMKESQDEIISAVCNEMIEMGLIQTAESIESTHSKWVEWANVIFDHPRKKALGSIYNWLEQYGLVREENDLEPTTDWDQQFAKDPCIASGSLFLAGRFGQWNYFWSDDCVLRGRCLGQNAF